MICVATDWPLREGFESDIIRRGLMREGISESEVTYCALLEGRPYAGKLASAGEGALEEGRLKLTAAICAAKPNVILSLGNYLSQWLTGCDGIDKWQASVLPCLLEGVAAKVIPCYSAERITQDLSLQLWLSLCCRKAASERTSPLIVRRPHVFLLNPPLADTLAFLNDRVAKADQISVDIETGRGQINTVGFAISESEAIAINVLPERFGEGSTYDLWRVLARILESDTPKILQNFIYEQLFFSRYGIRLAGVTHDTMIAQKFLWPEFEMGLDAVGRMYSEMPYWKDDGKSWNNIRDWEKHYEYNCKDTTGTWEGYLGQRGDLADAGLLELYDNYIRRLFPAVAEMCSRGLPVSSERLEGLRKSVSQELDLARTHLCALPGAESLNPRSPQQVKAFLTSPPRKYVIPKRYDSATKAWKESTDEKSLKKLRLKYPEDVALSLLLKVAKLGKAQSSYLNFGYDPDNRMRYSLTAGGTETMRWAGHCDPWDRGVNPQTIPGGNKGINIKSVFACGPGMTFLQCDLKQAETRFVAYDAPDAALIAVLEDPSRDIHREVAAEIFKVPISQVTKQQRQLGKKSGHGANYSMKEATFIDSCISEMDLVLSKQEATNVLEAYHRLFPGIRQWHANLRRELCQLRKLKTPWGWERHFYGRMNDDTFRQAYAFRPQSTVSYVINQLMLHLLGLRGQGAFKFGLLLQCHDSLLLELPEADVEPVAAACHRLSEWQQGLDLAGGRLIIPVETEVGCNYGELSTYEPGKTEAAN